MTTMEEAIDALADRDPDRRDDAAAVLGDLLRTRGLDQDSVSTAVARLVVLAVEDPVYRVRESALHSVFEALARLPLSLVEPLTRGLDAMSPELLEYALPIFGATQDPRARALIEPFLSHQDPKVRDEAELALAEIPENDTTNANQNS